MLACLVPHPSPSGKMNVLCLKQKITLVAWNVDLTTYPIYLPEKEMIEITVCIGNFLKHKK